MKRLESLGRCVGIGLSLAGLSFGAGCRQAATPPAPHVESLVQDVGGGVYVFPDYQFPKALGEWRETNPDKRVVDVSRYSGPHYGPGATEVTHSDDWIVVTEPAQAAQK